MSDTDALTDDEIVEVEGFVPVVRSQNHITVNADSYAVIGYGSRIDLAVLTMTPTLEGQRILQRLEGGTITGIKYAGLSQAPEFVDVARIRMETEIAWQVALTILTNLHQAGVRSGDELRLVIENMISDKEND